MSDATQERLSEFKVFSSFDGHIRLPVVGTAYQFKFRPHSAASGGRWFEGFLSPMEGTPRDVVFADEELKNSFKKDAARPAHFPERSSETPLHMKLNPFPKKKEGDADYIGSVWTSQGLFTIFAREKQGKLLLAGNVVPHRCEEQLRTRFDALVAGSKAAGSPAEPDGKVAHLNAGGRAGKGRGRAPAKDAG
jgi:hypothetical protein